ncbi:MAG: hypothetical protein ABSH11_11800 [Verrucomicrobiota bacterium]|jgi:hypothetical protein
MKSSDQLQPGAAGLLQFADLILGHARRLENLATWHDRLARFCSAVQADEVALSSEDTLQFAQAQRASGDENDELPFFIISWHAERSVEDIFETDRELNRLREKIRSIEKREGLPESNEFDPDHPETPADWKALNTAWNRHYQAVEKIRAARFIRWLRHHGELDMADLYANDRAAFDRRREAGRCILFGPLPDLNAAAGEGDTGLTQVITEDE